MSRTIPREFTGVPRLDAVKVAVIREEYHSALRDEDKSGEVDTAAYHEGRREAYEHVLDLLYEEETPKVLPESEGGPTQYPVRLIADYQMMGDHDGRTWADIVLGHAKSEGQILDYSVTGSFPGPYGVELVTFTVDVAAPGPVFPPHTTYEDARPIAEAFLNALVGDSDVDLRFMAPAA